jgi:hypothetical protein
MFSLASHPPDAVWGEAVRIEVDPTDRIQGLRFTRRAGTAGTAAVGLSLLVVSLLILRGSGSLPPIVYFGFVGALLALSPGIYLALTLNLRRVPDRIAFDEHGIHVHHLGGHVFEVRWDDPKIAIDLLNLGRTDFAGGMILFTSKMKGIRLDAAITPEGTAALRTEAERRGLGVEVRSEGAAGRGWGVIELRPPPDPEKAAADAASAAQKPTVPTDESSLSGAPNLEYGQ